MNKWMPSRTEVVAVVVVTLLLGVVLKTTFSSRRETQRLTYCQSNLQKIGLAVRQYTRDFDERYPLAHNWMDALYPFIKNNAVYQCPSVKEYGYGMNRYMSNAHEAAISSHETEPLSFDVPSTKRNAITDGNVWMSPGRHKEGNNVVFADAHVKWMQDKPSFNPIPTPTPRPTPTPKKEGEVKDE